MKQIIKLFLLSSIIVLFFSACNLLGNPLSPQDRLDAFEDDLNTESRAFTVDHIHPDATIYSSINENFWESSPLRTTYNPFDFSNVSLGAASGGIVSGTGTMTNGLSATLDVVITMKEDTTGSGDWYILFLSLDSGSGAENIIY